MKNTTIAVLAIASVASMASHANAVPFGPSDFPLGLSNQGGLPPGLTTQGSQPSGSPIGGSNPRISLFTPTSTVSSIPEGGTTLLLLGVGMIALVLWRRRWQQYQG
jgi:hypothetical protein